MWKYTNTVLTRKQSTCWFDSLQEKFFTFTNGIISLYNCNTSNIHILISLFCILIDSFLSLIFFWRNGLQVLGKGMCIYKMCIFDLIWFCLCGQLTFKVNWIRNSIISSQSIFAKNYLFVILDYGDLLFMNYFFFCRKKRHLIKFQWKNYKVENKSI